MDFLEKTRQIRSASYVWDIVVSSTPFSAIPNKTCKVRNVCNAASKFETVRLNDKLPDAWVDRSDV